MGRNSNISWTDHTFNIAWGYTKISPGCKNCYADDLSKRFGEDVWGPNKERKVLSDKYWRQPLKWNKEAEQEGVKRLVFTSSMCDVFEDHPTINAEREKLWPLIKATPHLIWQILTKRPENINPFLPEDWSPENYPNVWLGVSIESQDYAFRAEMLRFIPAKVRFISYEPALGPLSLNLSFIHWVIYGGESGRNRREDKNDWARSIRDQCRYSNVAFFYKQTSALIPGMGIMLDGKLYQQFPGEDNW